jgi:hypothetical protein
MRTLRLRRVFLCHNLSVCFVLEGDGLKPHKIEGGSNRPVYDRCLWVYGRCLLSSYWWSSCLLSSCMSSFDWLSCLVVVLSCGCRLMPGAVRSCLVWSSLVFALSCIVLSLVLWWSCLVLWLACLVLWLACFVLSCLVRCLVLYRGCLVLVVVLSWWLYCLGGEE